MFRKKKNHLNPQECFARGIAKIDQNKLDEAIIEFTEAINQDSQFFLAYLSRAYAYQKKGDLDKAVNDWTSVILNKRSDANLKAECYQSRGTAYFYKGNLDDAMLDYDNALHYEPNNALTYFNRGTLRDKKGDTDGAITDLTEAIRLDPRLFQAYSNLGAIRKDRGTLQKDINDINRSILDFEAALRINPDDPMTKENLQHARFIQGYLENQ